MNIEAYLKKDYISSLMEEGKRVDGRKFDEFREIEVEKGFVDKKAPGSARVKMGDTEVIVGISMDVGDPYPDKPESGVITTSAELRPVASPEFELGPPGKKATELARVVDRGIRESDAISLDDLFIEENKVWILFIDIHVLDHGGNLMDASGIGAMAALLNAKMPKLEDGQPVRGEWEGELPITKKPITVTHAKIGDHLVVDPTLDEGYASDARLTVTTSEDSIHSMQKSGFGFFTSDEVSQAIDTSFKLGKEIREKIEK